MTGADALRLRCPVTPDFSKQYNRLKQYQSAVSAPSAASHAGSSSAGGQLKKHSSAAIRSTPLPAINRSRPTPAATSSSSSQAAAGGSTSSAAQQETRLWRLINLAPYTPQPSINTKAAADRQNQKDKSDRATVEQVLDARTRLVLVKMINRGLVGKVEGCVSTGKEANVYHAWPPETPPVPTAHNPNPPALPKQIALKIFKTSILVFKDREKYITGEFRFKGGQSKNPRKMVRSASCLSLPTDVNRPR
jgi:RIO kinase 1